MVKKHYILAFSPTSWSLYNIVCFRLFMYKTLYMTYCCRSFKATQIRVIKLCLERNGLSRSQEAWYKTIQNYCLYQECTVVSQKMEDRMAVWSRQGGNTSSCRIAKSVLRYSFCKCSLSCASSSCLFYSSPLLSPLSSVPASHDPTCHFIFRFSSSLLLSAH